MTVGPGSGGLVQEETGQLRFGDHRGDATSRYLIDVEQPAKASIRHADGRLFHALDLSSGAADILHHCGDDIYRGRYRVLGNTQFFVNWRVCGPRKDYASATCYRR